MSASQHPPPIAGMHPRHPGVGSSTSLIRLEADAPENGGFVTFFPSGRHLNITWTQSKQITPTKEAALQFAGRLVEELNKISAKGDKSADDDLSRTNWTSLTAAIQRIILDWNNALTERISTKWAQEFGAPIRKQ